MSGQWNIGNRGRELALRKKQLKQQISAYAMQQIRAHIRKHVLLKYREKQAISSPHNAVKDTSYTYDSIKVAVITQSYYRKDGSSKKCLQNMFKMLEAQTYKKFKVFITGDNYQPESEFLEVCNEYKGEIYIHNNNHSCRDLNLGRIQNYWSYGGIHAAYNSYIKAKQEGFDIALMLDDDDHWYDSYVNSIVDNFIKYPKTAFMITKAEYGSQQYLPGTSIDSIYYNNYIPTGCDSVRSASAHNINLIGDIVLNFWKGLIEEVDKMNLEDKKWGLSAADMQLLNLIGAKVRSGEYKSLYIPTALVRKTSDCNWGNIK